MKSQSFSSSDIISYYNFWNIIYITRSNFKKFLWNEIILLLKLEIFLVYFMAS